MSKITKLTTGLTNLVVSDTPHYSLAVLYEKILKILHKMPSQASYRINTEAIVKQRLEHVKTTPDVNDLENKINCGQIEELIVQAENELSLARKFLKWQPWEPLIEPAPENQWKWPI